VEFKKRLTNLEDSDGLEASWNALAQALDDLQSTLTATSESLSRSHLTRNFHQNNLPCKYTLPRYVPD
jgi:hypothetical protein